MNASLSFDRLIRVASIWRRSQGNPFRILDKISDLRQEFSFSARRIAMAAFAELIAVHWFACIVWWTLRLQGYPQSKHSAPLVPFPYVHGQRYPVKHCNLLSSQVAFLSFLSSSDCTQELRSGFDHDPSVAICFTLLLLDAHHTSAMQES